MRYNILTLLMQTFNKFRIFSSPNIDFNVKYINTIDTALHNLVNGIVIVDIDEPNIVNILTTDAITSGILAVVTVVIIVVNDFLFLEFITKTIIDITNILHIGAIVAFITDIRLLPKLDNPHIGPTEKHLLINSATTHITNIIIAYLKY